MTSIILLIRAKQLFRVAGEAGIFRAIFLFALMCFVILALFVKLAETAYQELIVGVYAFAILSFHIKRKDKEFIRVYAAKPRVVFLTEYFLFSLPLLIALVYYQLWSFVLFFSLFLVAIQFLQTGTRAISINLWFQKIIPDDNFEWKAGIRKNLIVFTGVWFLGLTGSFFVASVPITIFILGVIVMGFYESSEPLQILLADELGTARFMIKKIKGHLMVFTLALAPLVLSFLIFHPQYYYIALAEFFMFELLLVYIIFLKYAFYRLDNRSGATGIFSMIGLISVFIPVFFPVVLILSLKFLFQAKNNLNFYLDDFN